MTVSSTITNESFTPLSGSNPAYNYSIPHTGDGGFEVWEVVSLFEYTVVDPADYTVTPYTGSPPLYTGGALTFNRAHPGNVTQIRLFRNTEVSQGIDYEPYARFPSETHEFGLDKLTLICQELNDAINSLQFNDTLLAARIDAIERDPPMLRARIDGTTVTSQQGTNLITSVVNDTVGTYEITLQQPITNNLQNLVGSVTPLKTTANVTGVFTPLIAEDQLNVYLADALFIPTNQAFSLILWDNNA